jgi:hypothetical protein
MYKCRCVPFPLRSCRGRRRLLFRVFILKEIPNPQERGTVRALEILRMCIGRFRGKLIAADGEGRKDVLVHIKQSQLANRE